jgi:antitoxin component of MazEF toxin-antitoxin module
MKVEKWGDELAIRLSDEIVRLMGLKEGQGVDIRAVDPDTIEIACTRGDERIVLQLRKSRTVDLGRANGFW